jgi:hypothetical protein
LLVLPQALDRLFASLLTLAVEEMEGEREKA